MEYTLVGGTFTIKAVNTWGLGLISTNREGTKRYFHFDALGSARALTDSSETVTDTYEYNAFGVVESSSGTSVNPYRYVGQYGYYDDGAMGSSSGLLLLGVRYYSPAHGRFWSWDPVPNLNLYAYVNNSATMAIDPSGRQARGGKVSPPMDACIHMLCAFELVDAGRKQVKKALKDPVGAIEDVLKKITGDKTAKDELDECIKRARSGKGWIYYACQWIVGNKAPEVSWCARNTPCHEECLACCDAMFREHTDQWNNCKHGRIGCAKRIHDDNCDEWRSACGTSLVRGSSAPCVRHGGGRRVFRAGPRSARSLEQDPRDRG